MITFDQFIAKYRGKTCTHPKGISGQCVCLFRCYVDEVLGVPQPPGVTGAAKLWNVADPKYFIRIPNSLTAVPRKGDAMIWYPWNGNPNGHVGMVISATILKFQSFDSNWSVPKKANIENHGYLSPRVIGWLRKR